MSGPEVTSGKPLARGAPCVAASTIRPPEPEPPTRRSRRTEGPAGALRRRVAEGVSAFLLVGPHVLKEVAATVQSQKRCVTQSHNMVRRCLCHSGSNLAGGVTFAPRRPPASFFFFTCQPSRHTLGSDVGTSTPSSITLRCDQLMHKPRLTLNSVLPAALPDHGGLASPATSAPTDPACGAERAPRPSPFRRAAPATKDPSRHPLPELEPCLARGSQGSRSFKMIA